MLDNPKSIEKVKNFKESLEQDFLFNNYLQSLDPKKLVQVLSILSSHISEPKSNTTNTST